MNVFTVTLDQSNVSLLNISLALPQTFNSSVSQFSQKQYEAAQLLESFRMIYEGSCDNEIN